MSGESFIDTNVLAYAVAGREADEPKRKRALDLIDGETFGLSAQVLQEFYVTVTRKIAAPLSADEALKWIEQLEIFPCQIVDRALVKVAAVVSERYQVSYWDAAILAAAESLGAMVLYTEDLNDGQFYGRV
ncbi:MAG: PIN domain-containing protein [Acidobacteria bacterium]|nr:PIN domain-containing protein [Acidobacteriota bacterium]